MGASNQFLFLPVRNFPLIFCLGVLSYSLPAQLRLAHVFGDHMVLQRNKPLYFWGQGNPGTSIHIRFGEDLRTTTCGASRHWEVTFPARDTGTPLSLTVWDGQDSLYLKDILMGEVWLCSGQSNMEWKLRQAANGSAEVSAAQYPQIRQLEVPKQLSFEPLSEFDSPGWKLAIPEYAGDFTAVGYYFARKLHEDLKVPVGLVLAAWGGSNVETWISHEAMAGSPLFKKYIAEKPISWEEDAAFWEKRTIAFFHGSTDLPSQALVTSAFLNPDFTATDWPRMQPVGQWDWKGIPSFRGKAYFHRQLQLRKDQVARESVLHFGWNRTVISLWINGTRVHLGYHPDKISISLPTHTFREGENTLLLHFGENVKGNGWSYMGFDGSSKDFRLDFPASSIMHLAEEGRVIPDWNSPRHYAQWMNNQGSLCFNGMIAPLIGFPLAGVIWYQGESNTVRANDYTTAFPLLIEDWRSRWGIDFPFLFVQLSSFGPLNDSQSGSAWAELREAQVKTLQVDNTGMVVTTDIGDPLDIHPLNKRDVGHRLALSAKHVAYKLPGVHSGPLFHQIAIKGKRAILSFYHTGTGLLARDKYGYLRGFEVAEEGGIFYPAQASIVGDKITVVHPLGKIPAMVRYGWSDSPVDANLYNREGLPASPFRTDKLPGLTLNNHFYDLK